MWRPRPPKAKADRDYDRDHAYHTQRARFCLVTGIQPSEYDRMTVTEIAIFTDVHNQLHPED